MTPFETVLERLPNARRFGGGWSAKCPAHEDRRASLSISEAEDGKVLVKCHAGCDTEEVVAAIGLTMADLFSADGRCIRNGRPTTERRVFSTVDEAVTALEHRHGHRSGLWTYHNANHDPVGIVIRWDHAHGKDIRPLSRVAGGWCIGAMPDPRPLYGLPHLIPAQRVIVVEGEKCVDAARALGMVATTSSGGSQAADKTDWQPLAVKEVWIMPDNDAAGRKYAENVATILAKLDPAPEVRVIELPDLPDGGDVADWITAHGDAAEPGKMRAEIETLAQAVAPYVTSVTDGSDYRPFPIEVLPEPIRSLVDMGGQAIGCDASYLALPLMTALAAAIGNTRRLEIKRGWCVPPILWSAVVGESGTAKTPAFQLVMRPTRQRQFQAFRVFETSQQDFERRYETWLACNKRDRGNKPDPPVCERFLVEDTTLEALAPILSANKRGVLLARDELAGWFGSFDRYSNNRKVGADAMGWLSLFNGELALVDRKTGRLTIHAEQAAVCITGGIQPAILRRVLTVEHLKSGLAARLLLAYPPRRAKAWSEDDIDPQVEAELIRIFERLYDLEPVADGDKAPRPAIVQLSTDAKTTWKNYYNDHAQEQVHLKGDLAAAWSKLEEYAARLALVVHFVRWAAGEVTDPSQLDLPSMTSGITLATWFKYEARRIYAMLDGPDSADQQRLIDWIGRRGGVATPREIQQGCRWLRAPGAAEAALDAMASAGRGTWSDLPTTPKGGRPTRAFTLS